MADIAVVGGGAAGLTAAVFAARAGASVAVFEKNDKAGRKLRITGKGRCNLTNDCDINEFLRNVPTNPRFLYSALNSFSPEDVKNFFEELGVPLKIERGRRVFPVSDRADDIADALASECKRLGVKFIKEKVLNVTADKKVVTSRGERSFDAVIIATGGISYPKTGSDGDGYRFAKSLGHTVIKPEPSLVPLVAGGICAECQGLSLKNVGFKIKLENGTCVYEDFGELMFTHFGITGPVVLSASAHLDEVSAGKYFAVIDLKPALDEKTLDSRILSDFAKYSNRDFCNSLSDLLPTKLIEPIVAMSGIDGRKKVNLVTREERLKLVELLKNLTISIKSKRPVDEAVITRGGVSVKEIDPRTIESKLVENIYFAGEVIDVDAYTGGYNLQIAFSTGKLAGESAADK